MQRGHPHSSPTNGDTGLGSTRLEAGQGSLRPIRVRESIVLLRHGQWPRDYELPEGYQGRSDHGDAACEAALAALANLDVAWARIRAREPWFAGLIDKRY